MGKKPLQIGFIIVAFAGAAVLIGGYLLKPGNEAEAQTQTTYWICRNPECGNQFTATLAEVAEAKNADGAFPCPKCQKSLTNRALLCPNCERIIQPVGHGSFPETCEHCKQRITVTPEFLKKMRSGG